MDSQEFSEMLKQALKDNLEIIKVGNPNTGQKIIVIYDGETVAEEE